MGEKRIGRGYQETRAREKKKVMVGATSMCDAREGYWKQHVDEQEVLDPVDRTSHEPAGRTEGIICLNESRT